MVSISTTISELISDLKGISPNFKNRNYIGEHFKENDFYYLQNPITGDQYIIQKVINSNKKKS